MTDYEYLKLTRHLGRGITVDTAPQKTKIPVSGIVNPTVFLSFDGDIVTFADQVAYQITGYDPEDCTLTLKLIHDWRPGQKDDPSGTTQT